MQLYLCLHDLLIYSWWCDRLLFWLYQIILLVIPTGACFFVIGQDRIGLIRGNCWRKLLCCSLSKYRMETLVCPLYPPLHDVDNNDDCYAWKLEFKQVGLIYYFRKNLIKTHHKSCDWKVFFKSNTIDNKKNLSLTWAVILLAHCPIGHVNNSPIMTFCTEISEKSPSLNLIFIIIDWVAMPRNEKIKHGGYYSTKGFHYKTPCSNIPYSNRLRSDLRYSYYIFFACALLLCYDEFSVHFLLF